MTAARPAAARRATAQKGATCEIPPSPTPRPRPDRGRRAGRLGLGGHRGLGRAVRPGGRGRLDADPVPGVRALLRGLPAHSISKIAKKSGARYLTLAFIQTPKKGSCTATWNGDAKQPLSGGHYLAEIAALRHMGGNVIPSFGGFSADHGGTEIADSCTSVSKIAAAYELLVSKYHVTRLDMDVEDRSLNNLAGITRRSEAIAMAQAWAAARGINLQVDFTIPVEPYGLDPNGLNVIQNAVAHHVKVTVVNIMTFDYYETHEGRVDMAAAAMAAALNLHNQLAACSPTTARDNYGGWRG